MFQSDQWLRHGIEFAMDFLKESTVGFVTDYLFWTNTNKDNFLKELSRETQIILVYNKMAAMAKQKRLVRINFDKFKRTPKADCQFRIAVCRA